MLREFILQNQEVIKILLQSLLTFLGVKIALAINKHFKLKRGIEIIENSVKAVEQVAPALKIKGVAKFEKAKEMIIKSFNDNGIKMTDEDIKLFIEKFVYEVKEVAKNES